MNQAFDYNGVVVAQSAPKKVLRTVKKTIHIDSADRDTTRYLTNGDFWVYLPRNYSNVVSIRLKDAQFPQVAPSASIGALTHDYINGQNIPSATYVGKDTQCNGVNTPYYFLISLEGLNKVDETSVGADRSTFADSFFAKIPHVVTFLDSTSVIVNYNDNSNLENIATYSPPIENLDRLHITIRTHAQQNKSGFMYWTSDGTPATAFNTNGLSNFNLTFEIEYLENAFTDFSSFETRLAQRS
jgi:hypothetical protein